MTDVVSRGWRAQEAALASFDEASTVGWEADYYATAGHASRAPYRSPWLPTCAHGCRDPWTTDPACDVHATDSKERTE